MHEAKKRQKKRQKLQWRALYVKYNFRFTKYTQKRNRIHVYSTNASFILFSFKIFCVFFSSFYLFVITWNLCTFKCAPLQVYVVLFVSFISCYYFLIDSFTPLTVNQSMATTAINVFILLLFSMLLTVFSWLKFRFYAVFVVVIVNNGITLFSKRTIIIIIIIEQVQSTHSHIALRWLSICSLYLRLFSLCIICDVYAWMYNDWDAMLDML